MRLLLISVALTAATHTANAQTLMESVRRSDAPQICDDKSNQVNPAKLARLLVTSKFALNGAQLSTLIENSIEHNLAQGSPIELDYIFLDTLRSPQSHQFAGIEDLEDELISYSDEFADYLISPTAPVIFDVSVDPAFEANAAPDRQTFLNAFLNEESISLTCPASAPSPKQKQDEAVDSYDLISNFRFRGEIEGLSAERPQNARSASAVARFNGLEAARLAFTNNGVTDTTTVSIKLAAGVDLAPLLFDDISESFDIIPFVSYELSDTDAPAPMDGMMPPPNTDIEQLSTGLLVTKVLDVPATREFGLVLGEFSATTFGTFDLEQDARTLRGRVELEASPLIPWSRNRRAELCGGNLVLFSGLRFKCESSLITEIGHVFQAGSSLDLMTLEDDQFVGLGGSISGRLFFSPYSDAPDFLKQFSLQGSARYLGIVSGTLENQNRYRASLSFSPQNLRFVEASVTYETGENIETFQDEEITRFSIGFRY